MTQIPVLFLARGAPEGRCHSRRLREVGAELRRKMFRVRNIDHTLGVVKRRERPHGAHPTTNRCADPRRSPRAADDELGRSRDPALWCAMSWSRYAPVLLAPLCACSQPDASPRAADPPSATVSPPRDDAAHAAVASPSGGTVLASAPVGSAAPTAAPPELLALPPSAEMKDAKAYVLEHKARIGVYFGLPEGWRYDDPSWLAITPRDLDSGGWFVALRLSDEGLSEANEQRLLERGPKATRLADPSWQPWQSTVAGRPRWPAKLRRGSGRDALGKHGELLALAGEIAVPDTPAVGFVASWPKSQPALESTLLDIVRHLHRCKVEVGMGCVPEE
jgi:hypothetical protein